MNFEIIDISGDIGLRAYGSSLSEAFVNAGLGMYSLITDIGNIGCKRDLIFDISSESLEGLLVNYLNELIFHFDAYGFVGCRIEIAVISDTCIKAKVFGDDFNPNIHSKGLLIKAATYHNLNIQKTGDVFSLDVIFDI